MVCLLASFIIIQNIINVNCIGLIVGSECVPFDSISSYPDTSNQSHQIGWIKVISCFDQGDDFSVNPFTFHRSDYLSLTSRAISIKFQPPGGVNNPNYERLAVFAIPYTNPIQYGLNYNHSVSWTYDADGSVIGHTLTTNWIGTSIAVARLNQGDCAGTYKEYPHNLHQRVYHACGNFNGIHIFPNQDGTAVYKCKWENANEGLDDIEVYFGFVPEDCPTDTPIESPTTPPSMHPTKYPKMLTFIPTISPTNNPSWYPSKTDTMRINNISVHPKEYTSISPSNNLSMNQTLSPDDDAILSSIHFFIGLPACTIIVFIVIFLISYCVCHAKSKNSTKAHNDVELPAIVERNHSLEGVVRNRKNAESTSETIEGAPHKHNQNVFATVTPQHILELCPAQSNDGYGDV